jgi:hypothetical protein
MGDEEEFVDLLSHISKRSDIEQSESKKTGETLYVSSVLLNTMK